MLSYHLSTHAMFKALLFLTSGILIHSLAGNQDIRKLGGGPCQLAYVSLLIGFVALVGLSSFSGFYSKDLILNLTAGNSYGNHWLVFMAVYLTASYSVKVVTSIQLPKTRNSSYWHSPGIMAWVPIILLAVATVTSGFVMRTCITENSTSYLRHDLVTPTHALDATILPTFTCLVPMIFSLVALVFAVTLTSNEHPTPRTIPMLWWNTMDSENRNM